MHVLRSYVMQSRDCPEYREKLRDESVTSRNLKRSTQVLIFTAYFAKAALTGMSSQASATPCGVRQRSFPVTKHMQEDSASP